MNGVESLDKIQWSIKGRSGGVLLPPVPTLTFWSMPDTMGFPPLLSGACQKYATSLVLQPGSTSHLSLLSPPCKVLSYVAICSYGSCTVLEVGRDLPETQGETGWGYKEKILARRKVLLLLQLSSSFLQKLISPPLNKKKKAAGALL